MHQIDDITALADRAAALLPEAPAKDAVAYLAWRELVWSTALRLAEFAGTASPGVLPADGVAPAGHRLSGADLLGLGLLLRSECTVALAPGASAPVSAPTRCARQHAGSRHNVRPDRHVGGAVQVRR